MKKSMNIKPIRTAIIVISIARSTIRFEILQDGHFWPWKSRTRYQPFLTQFGPKDDLPWWEICIIKIVSINQMFETEIHETKNIDDRYSQWIRWLFMVFIQFHFSMSKNQLNQNKHFVVTKSFLFKNTLKYNFVFVWVIWSSLNRISAYG